MMDFSGQINLMMTLNPVFDDFDTNYCCLLTGDVNKNSSRLGYFELFVMPNLLGRIATGTDPYSAECATNVNSSSLRMPK